MRRNGADFFGTMMLMVLLFVLNGGINFRDPEVLLRIFIVLILILAVALYIWFEIIPVALLRLGRMNFRGESDFEQYEITVNHFFDHHHPKEKEYIGWLYRAEIELYKGNYLDALDLLVNITKKDLEFDRANEIKVALLRCKIMMFLKNLTSENPSFELVRKKKADMDNEDLHNYALISCWLNMENSYTKVQDAIIKLGEALRDAPDGERYRQYNEFLWLHGLQARRKNDEQEIISVHNQLIVNHAMNYLLSSFKSG